LPEAADRLAQRFEHLVRAIIGDLFRGDLASERDDAVQEAWIRIFNGIALWRAEAPFCQYLAVITGRSAIDFRRRISCRRRRQRGEIRDAPDRTFDPSIEAGWRETISRARALLDTSPSDLREVWELHFAGRSSKEIAMALGISVRTVQWRLAKAFKRLQNGLLGQDMSQGERLQSN
jgi:RNA polymerase sigma-70 factor (ECF subfamily)